MDHVTDITERRVLEKTGTGSIMPANGAGRRYRPGLWRGLWMLMIAVGLSSEVSAREMVVRIDRSGVYEISFERLRELGFGKPEKTAVYGFPAQALSTNNFGNGYRSLPPLAQTLTGSGLEFYAEGPETVAIGGIQSASVSRNTYSSGNYYLLSDEKDPEIAESTSEPAGECLKAHIAATIVEEELESPSEIGTFFYGQEMKADIPVRVSYSLDRPVKGTGICHIFKYCAMGQDPIKVKLGVPEGFDASAVEDNGIHIEDSSIQNYDYATCRYTLSPTVNTTGDNLEISYTASSTAAIKFARIDYGICLYERENAVDAAHPWIEMNFMAGEGEKQAVLTAPAGRKICVWSIDKPFRPVRLTAREEAGSYGIALPSDTGYGANCTIRVCAWISGAGYPEPAIMETTAGDPVIRACDGLIVCSRSLMDEALEMAEIHKRLLGLELVTVCQDDIFHKYSSSTPHAMAVRMFARDLMEKSISGGRAFRGIMLYGPASWDQRGIIYNVPDRVITYNVEDESDGSLRCANYSSDQYFGFLDDVDFSKFKETEMTVAVGRIPVTGTARARGYNRKVERLLGHPAASTAPNSLLVMSDDGDANLHLTQMENLADLFSEKRPGGVVYKAHNMLFPWKNNMATTLNKYARTALERGVGMMFAASHGGPTGMGAEVLWNNVMARDTKYSDPPLMLLATCSAYNFDRQSGSFGEELLFNPEGGASALVTSSRSVYMDYNYRLCKEMLQALQTADKAVSAGEIFRRARNAMVGVVNSRNLITNVLCYHYFGSPFMPAPVITSSIEGLRIEAADGGVSEGYRVLEGDNIRLPSGSLLRVSGRVTGVDDGREGEISLSVLESPYEMTTFVRGTGKDRAVKVSMRDRLLTCVTQAVTGNEFSIDFRLPESAGSVEDKVLSVCYSSADGDIRAVADMVNVSVTPGDTAPEQTASRISALYIDTPAFTDGDMVSDRPVAVLEIMPGASGLYSNSAGVGKGLRVRLDGQELTRVTTGSLRSAGPGRLAAEINLGDLRPGVHTLSADIRGNDDAGDSRDISFIVKAGTAALPAIRTDAGVTAGTVEISLAGELPEGTGGTWRINADGAEGTVRTFAPPVCFPLKWDFTDDAGKKLPSGSYCLRAWFTPEGGKEQAAGHAVITYIPVDSPGENTGACDARP